MICIYYYFLIYYKLKKHLAVITRVERALAQDLYFRSGCCPVSHQLASLALLASLAYTVTASSLTN